MFYYVIVSLWPCLWVVNVGGKGQLLRENIVPKVIFHIYYRSLVSDLNSLRNWWLRGQQSGKTFHQQQFASPELSPGNEAHQDQSIPTIQWLDPWHFPTAMSGKVQ